MDALKQLDLVEMAYEFNVAEKAIARKFLKLLTNIGQEESIEENMTLDYWCYSGPRKINITIKLEELKCE